MTALLWEFLALAFAPLASYGALVAGRKVGVTTFVLRCAGVGAS